MRVLLDHAAENGYDQRLKRNTVCLERLLQLLLKFEQPDMKSGDWESCLLTNGGFVKAICADSVAVL